MKHIVIIEDESIAAQHLERMLHAVLPDAVVAATLQSIEESVEYFTKLHATAAAMPDIVFMDIHLADGLSFRIFDHVDIPSPIIFTTAYDQYALDAFKVNSIDYLLKPIGQDDLRHALDKLSTLTSDNRQQAIQLSQAFRHYRSHFLIPVRDKLVPLDVSQIACLYLEDKISRAILFDGTRQALDCPLDTLMEQLDPTLFFRANRQYIVAHKAIKEISLWPIGKLALTLQVDTPDRIIVSRAKAPEFKQWFTQ